MAPKNKKMRNVGYDVLYVNISVGNFPFFFCFSKAAALFFQCEIFPITFPLKFCFYFIYHHNISIFLQEFISLLGCTYVHGLNGNQKRQRRKNIQILRLIRRAVRRGEIKKYDWKKNLWKTVRHQHLRFSLWKKISIKRKLVKNKSLKERITRLLWLPIK